MKINKAKFVKRYEIKCASKSIDFPVIHVKNINDLEEFCRKHLFDEIINVREVIYALYFNRANNLIGYYEVGKGGVSSTIADPRLILKPAIDCLASGIVIIHNHPSNNSEASQIDKTLTNKVS